MQNTAVKSLAAPFPQSPLLPAFIVFGNDCLRQRYYGLVWCKLVCKHKTQVTCFNNIVLSNLLFLDSSSPLKAPRFSLPQILPALSATPLNCCHALRSRRRCDQGPSEQTAQDAAQGAPWVLSALDAYRAKELASAEVLWHHLKNRDRVGTRHKATNWYGTSAMEIPTNTVHVGCINLDYPWFILQWRWC